METDGGPEMESWGIRRVLSEADRFVDRLGTLIQEGNRISTLPASIGRSAEPGQNLYMAAPLTNEMSNGQLLLTTLSQLQVPQAQISSDNALELLASAVEALPPASKGTSLYTATLDNKQWDLVNKINRDLSKEYALRRELLLKRLDVTVDSFTWSEKGAHKKDEVLKTYEEARSKINCNTEVEMSDLIAAKSDLLFVDKTSSSAVRARTQNPLRKFLLSENPADRGGRTSEVVAPEPEVPSWKKGGRGGGGGRNYRGGHRGRGHHRGNNLESQVKDEIRTADRRAHGDSAYGGPSVGPISGHNYDDSSRHSKRGRHH
uniref:Protein FAM98A n=1 Tax=Steinernema glaseri TaxID=37863 RepID=A0A1I7ZHP8_9BILA